MNYAFMSFSCPELNLEEFLTVARHHGYDAVEPRAQSGHLHGIEFDATPEQRREIRTRAEDEGIPYCCLATSCKYADPATVEANVSDTMKAIDLAADIGCPRLRVFGGAIPEGINRKAATEAVAKALRGVADHAAARAVTICLETHDHWCDPADVVRLMKQVNHPAIAVNWDIMHPVRVAGKTMDEAYKALKPWIQHVHFHDGVTEDGKLRMVPIGEGQIDHKRALQLLMDAGYTGYLSGEWIRWEPHEIHLPRELAAMQAYEASLVTT